MSSRNLILVCCLRILEAGMQILVFFIILFMLSYTFVTEHDTRIITCLFISSIPVFVLYIARHHIHNSIVLFILHIGVAAFIFSMGNTAEEKVAYIIMGAILIIFSVSLCIKEQRENSEKLPVGLIGVFIGAVILGNYLGFDMITGAGIYCGEIYIILQVIHHNFSNVNHFIVLNRESKTLPAKQMIAVNTFIMSILITLCFGVIQIFGNGYVNRLLLSIVTLIKDAVFFVLRFLFSFGNHEVKEPAAPNTLKDKGMAEFNALTQDSIWTNILNTIVTIIGIALIIGFVILITVGLVRLVKRMGSSYSGEDVKEFIISKQNRESKIRRGRKEEREITSNAKARKIYKSVVTKNAAKSGNKIIASMVPADISKLYINGDQNTATDIYEKARYSNKQITQEEIDTLKKYRKA